MVDSQAVVATVVLVALQLIVLRASQHAMPSLYFTTSSFFDRRADVSGRAVLFRLTVPFAAGILAALLVPDDPLLVAGVAGGLCWFLVIWPILWNPRLVKHRFSLPFVGVLVAFACAFVAVPIAGAALVEIVDDALSGDGREWESQYVWALITGGTFAAVSQGASHFAGKRLSFVDDDPPSGVSHSEPDETHVESIYGDEDDLEPTFRSFLLLYGLEIVGFVAAVMVSVASVTLLTRRRS